MLSGTPNSWQNGGAGAVRRILDAPMGLFSVERQLSATSGKLRRAREELGLVTEQLAALRSDAEDAMTDALVRGGQAKREAAEAGRHVERLAAAQKKLQQQIIELGREQDELLDRLPTT